jgi:mRNA interferase MazF
MEPFRRGAIWWADLNPVEGHEQGGDRPCLILSRDSYSNGPTGLIVIVPLSRQIKPHLSPLHVRIDPPEGGLADPGVILCDQVRCISHGRVRRSSGTVSRRTLQHVEETVRAVLQL